MIGEYPPFARCFRAGLFCFPQGRNARGSVPRGEIRSLWGRDALHPVWGQEGAR